jgi:excisionase family DNA binding protein
MPVTINGETYYRTAEACRIVGISKTTFFRWLKENILKEADSRDRRGWRLFTEEELNRFKAEANRIIKNNQSGIAKGATSAGAFLEVRNEKRKRN